MPLAEAAPLAGQLSLFTRELVDLLKLPLVPRKRLCRAGIGPNAAVLADVERPSKRHGPRVRHHAVGAGGLLGGIAQDWVIQLQRLGKTDVALDADGRITTSSEVGDVKFP